MYFQAHVIVTGTSWTRIYFVIFYLFTIVVLTLVVAAILEAFVTYKSGAKPKRRVVGAVPALIDQFMLRYVGSSNSVIDVNNEI